MKKIEESDTQLKKGAKTFRQRAPDPVSAPGVAPSNSSSFVELPFSQGAPSENTMFGHGIAEISDELHSVRRFLVPHGRGAPEGISLFDGGREPWAPVYRAVDSGTSGETWTAEYALAHAVDAVGNAKRYSRHRDQSFYQAKMSAPGAKVSNAKVSNDTHPSHPSIVSPGNHTSSEDPKAQGKNGSSKSSANSVSKKTHESPAKDPSRSDAFYRNRLWYESDFSGKILDVQGAIEVIMSIITKEGRKWGKMRETGLWRATDRPRATPQNGDNIANCASRIFSLCALPC